MSSFNISGMTSDELRFKAYETDTNNILKPEDEILVFKNHTDAQQTSDELFIGGKNTATNPIQAESAVAATPDKVTVSGAKGRRLESRREDVLKNIIKNSTLDNLIDELKNNKNYEVREYKDLIDEIEEVIEFVEELNISSKADANKVSQKIYKNKNFSKFQKSIRYEIEKLAEKKLIEEEVKALNKIYADIRENSEDEKVNYTEVLKQVEDEIKAKGIKNSKKAMKQFKEGVKEEIQDNALSKMMDLKANEVSADTKAKVKKEIKSEYDKSDKFARRVIAHSDTSDTDARVTKNRLNRERKRIELEKIPQDLLIKELGTELYAKLEGFIEAHSNEDGTYDITSISDEIRKAVGADEEMNFYEDYNKSEKKEALDNLRILTGCKGLNLQDVKRLKKLCDIADAPKKRDAGSAFLNGAIPGSVAALAVGSALGRIEIKNLTEVNVGEFIQIIVDQVIKVNPTAVFAAGQAIGFIVTGLVNLIFGQEKGERTCFDYEDAKDKTFDEYKHHVEMTVDNPKKRDAIIALAAIYYNEYKDEWNEHFIADLKQASGNGVLNCTEFRMGMASIKKDIAKGPEEVKNDAHFYSTREVTTKTPIYQDVPTIDGRRTSWSKIAHQYECLVEKYTLNGAIRILKIVQAITNGDYSEANIENLYRLSKQGRNAMKTAEGFDYDVYCNMLDANVLSDKVKVPAKIADCDRDESISLVVKRNNNNNSSGAKTAIILSNGCYVDQVKVDEKNTTTYYARFDDGEAKEYATEQDRTADIDKYKKDYPEAESKDWEDKKEEEK